MLLTSQRALEGLQKSKRVRVHNSNHFALWNAFSAVLLTSLNNSPGKAAESEP
jgi:hypothetical protein